MQSARIKGYSSAWLHHKGRNKHHMEYWIDYGVPDEGGDKGLCGMKMPLRYVVEMYIDRVAASKNYQKERYTDRSALEYYLHGKDFHVMHKDTRALLELLFVPARCPGRAGSQYIYPRRTAGREDPL